MSCLCPSSEPEAPHRHRQQHGEAIADEVEAQQGHSQQQHHHHDHHHDHGKQQQEQQHVSISEDPGIPSWIKCNSLLSCFFSFSSSSSSSSTNLRRDAANSSRKRMPPDMADPSSSSCYDSSSVSSSSLPHLPGEYPYQALSSPAVLMKEPRTVKKEIRDHVLKNLRDGASPDLPAIASSPELSLCPLSFSYSELRIATQNFSRVLGEGGFGYVYKGKLKLPASFDDCALPDDRTMEVAVKQLNLNGNQGHKEWLAEIRFLGMLEHPNLVRLVGYCGEEHERGMQRLLVYEFMENGSLEDHLFESSRSPLSWKTRLYILLGAAQGLAYLHEGIDGLQVIFRDFKASNVLLDADFNAKLSDFGLARQGPGPGASHVSTTVLGTLGYAAPEYIQTGHLTAKSDVWSFGVVLLEILSGRRSLDKNRPSHEQNLLQWAKPWLQGNRRIEYMMDPKLVGGGGGGYSQVQADRVLRLARECLNKYPRERPRMSIIVRKLKEIVDLNDPYVVQAEADGDLATTQPIRLKRHRRRSCVRWIIEAAVCY